MSNPKSNQIKIKNDLVTQEMKTLFVNGNQNNFEKDKLIDEDFNDGNNNDLRSTNQVNFNNAIFNKNFIPVQQMQLNENQEVDLTLNMGQIPNEMFVNDDLSSLPQIDDKILYNCLKYKFENRKYFVSSKFLKHLKKELKKNIFFFYFIRVTLVICLFQ
jgi:hypothetical protein